LLSGAEDIGSYSVVSGKGLAASGKRTGRIRNCGAVGSLASPPSGGPAGWH